MDGCTNCAPKCCFHEGVSVIFIVVLQISICMYASTIDRQRYIDLCGSTKSKDSLTRSGAVFSRKPH